MLQQIRDRSKSWVGIILAGFMIMLFAIWGIEDIFRPGVSRSTTIVAVGEVKMSAREFQNTYQRMVPVWQRQLNTTIDYQTAKRLGLVERIIQNVVNSALFSIGARDAGIAVSNDVVRADIRANRNFQGVTGQFDEQTFRNALRNVQMSESTYVAERRGELARAQLAETIATVGDVPKSYLEALLRFRNEKRVVEVVTVPNAKFGNVKDPDEATLRKFHKDNAARFTAPTMRKVTAIIVRPDDVVQEIKVTEEQIKSAYDDRKAEFTSPETRTISQILVRDEANAKKAYDAIKGGKSFDDAAKEITGSAALSLGKLKKQDMPIAALSDAAFALSKDEVSKPVKSPLGWHIFKVTEIEPEKVKTMDAVRRDLIKGIRKEKSVDVLSKLSETLDDEIGGGSKLEEAAKKLNLKLYTFPGIDVRGNDIDGNKIKNLPADRKFLVELFKLDKGEESLIVDLADGGFFIVRADDIIPARLRPFDTVKKQVLDAWKEAQRQKKAKAEAEKIAAKIKGGQKIAIVAAAEGLTMRTTKAITRAAPIQTSQLSRTFQAKAFEAKKDQVFTGPVPSGYAVGIVTKIEEPDAAASKKDVATLKRRLRSTLGTELLLEYSRALRDRYTVEINRTAIDLLFNPTQTN